MVSVVRILLKKSDQEHFWWKILEEEILKMRCFRGMYFIVSSSYKCVDICYCMVRGANYQFSLILEKNQWLTLDQT